MLYLTCTMISSVDLAHYGVSRAKDLVHVSVDCGTSSKCQQVLFLLVGLLLKEQKFWYNLFPESHATRALLCI